ncbi:MAG: SRPBCC domain-containing protein [Caldilineaceae bacterium]
MNVVTIRKEIEIAAPASQIWRYIGNAAGLHQWWDVEVSLEEKMGGYCEERGHQDGWPYHLIGEVTVYEPPQRLALALRRQGDPSACPARTELEITLTEAEGATKVTIVHRAYSVVNELSLDAVMTPAHSGWQGPWMALPGLHFPNSPLPDRPEPTAPLIGLALPSSAEQTLTTWQQQQAERWHCFATMLQLFIVPLTQEVLTV